MDKTSTFGADTRQLVHASAKNESERFLHSEANLIIYNESN